MTLLSSDERSLACAEDALVRYGLADPGHLSVADESTLRQALALARLSLQTSGDPQRSLGEFRRAVLATSHALFGETAEAPRPPHPELLRAAAGRLWRLTLSARDELPQPRAWEAAMRRRQLVLALGGGGGVGYVYLGVFALLEEWGLRPELIAGTSFGAILGLLRAQRLTYRGEDIAEILGQLSFSKLFRLFPVQSRYALPGPVGLYLRSALDPVLQVLARQEEIEQGSQLTRPADGSHHFDDLAIPLVVTVAGVRKGMLPRAPKEYERLLDPRSFFPPTPRQLQRRAQDLLSVLGEFVRQPNRLDAVYVGTDETSRQVDVLDAIGFSCSLPGFIHYDVLREDTLAHQHIQRLLDQRELGWLADGGLVENCPMRAAHQAFYGEARAAGTPRNGFILGLDAFSPKLSTVPWLPIQRLAQETVRRVQPYANLYLPFPRTLSPLSVLPTKEQVKRALVFGRAELAPHMPFLAKMLTPLPALEASRPGDAR